MTNTIYSFFLIYIYFNTHMKIKIRVCSIAYRMYVNAKIIFVIYKTRLYISIWVKIQRSGHRNLNYSLQCLEPIEEKEATLHIECEARALPRRLRGGRAGYAGRRSVRIRVETYKTPFPATFLFCITLFASFRSFRFLISNALPTPAIISGPIYTSSLPFFCANLPASANEKHWRAVLVSLASWSYIMCMEMSTSG